MAHRFNGVDVRTPTSFDWDIEDIYSGESGRTLDGKLHIDVIAQKRNLSYAWLDPSKEEVRDILQLIDQKGSVEITYPDAKSGEYETGIFMVMKRVAPFREFRVGARLYTKLSLEFKEV
jgi:hypothetical protein